MHWLFAAISHPVTLVAVGSAAGGVCRYNLTRAVALWPAAAGWPWATFAINVLGSGTLGFLAAAGPRREWLLLLGTGFCGGFTTFSAFSVETLHLLREERWAAAGAYVLASVAVSLAAAAGGYWLGRG